MRYHERNFYISFRMEDDKELEEMLQLRGFYGLVTNVATTCFGKCVPGRGDLRKLDGDHRQCLANCAVAQLELRMLMSSTLLKRQSMPTFPSSNDSSSKDATDRRAEEMALLLTEQDE